MDKLHGVEIKTKGEREKEGQREREKGGNEKRGGVEGVVRRDATKRSSVWKRELQESLDGIVIAFEGGERESEEERNDYGYEFSDDENEKEALVGTVDEKESEKVR